MNDTYDPNRLMNHPDKIGPNESFTNPWINIWFTYPNILFVVTKPNQTLFCVVKVCQNQYGDWWLWFRDLLLLLYFNNKI